jgi:polysaccharide pyruvyl transferase CsaB
MSKVVISGYYGFDNAGDEALLYAMITSLRQLKPKLEIVVLSNKPEKTSADYKVKAVNRWLIPEIWSAVKQADLLISGGGSLLQDVTGSRSIIYYLAVVLMAKFMGVPVMFYAQGIGPVTQKLNKLLIGKIGNKVDVITVRDRQSLEDLKELGVIKPMSRVTADPVLAVAGKQISLERGKEILTKAGIVLDDPRRPVLGISVREWPGLELAIPVLARVIDSLVETQGCQVVFLAMHNPKDLSPAWKISRLMSSQKVVLQEKYQIEELFSLIGNLDALVGMRLHALIMAAVMGVPQVGVSYDPKVDRFMEVVEQPIGGWLPDLDDTILREAITGVLTNKEAIRGNLLLRTQELAEKAFENAVLAVSMLKG